MCLRKKKTIPTIDLDLIAENIWKKNPYLNWTVKLHVVTIFLVPANYGIKVVGVAIVRVATINSFLLIMFRFFT